MLPHDTVEVNVRLVQDNHAGSLYIRVAFVAQDIILFAVVGFHVPTVRDDALYNEST